MIELRTESGLLTAFEIFSLVDKLRLVLYNYSVLDTVQVSVKETPFWGDF